MLFGILSVVFLHYHTTCKDRCCRLPFPRIFLWVWNFLSLCLYITAIATWYRGCPNQFGTCIGPYDITAGYCIATAIVCVVMSFFAWLFSFWRSCWPNKDEPADSTVSSAGAAPGYAHQMSASDLGAKPTPAAAPAASNGNYGGETYGNNDDAADSGGGGGGYGGSYGGAYSNSGYGGSSGKQQSAYGY